MLNLKDIEKLSLEEILGLREVVEEIADLKTSAKLEEIFKKCFNKTDQDLLVIGAASKESRFPYRIKYHSASTLKDGFSDEFSKKVINPYISLKQLFEISAYINPKTFISCEDLVPGEVTYLCIDRNLNIKYTTEDYDIHN